MTIDDEIKDEKLQYDIAREAAKILASSSGKYEYLTREEILHCNQQQIIEQAKFTYSPLGKSFEKQTKLIEDQRVKQIKTINDNKKQLANINEDYNNKVLLSKVGKIFKDIFNERLVKIGELEKNVDYDNLKYFVKSSDEEFALDKSENPMIFLDHIKTGKILIEEAKNLQQHYGTYLKRIRKGNKSAEQKKLWQILTFFLIHEMMLSNLQKTIVQ